MNIHVFIMSVVIRYGVDSVNAGYTPTTIQCDDPIFIIYQFFISPNPLRHKEIQHCLQKNVENPHIQHVLLLNERIYTDEELGCVSDKIIQINVTNRLKYSDVIQYCQTNLDQYRGYWVIINSDIFFDTTINHLRYTDMHIQRKMWALLRWELPQNYAPNTNEILPTVLENPSGDTQDCWIFHSNHTIYPTSIQFLDFQFGVPGCDNKMIHVAHVLGFDIVNDPNLVRSYHYHTSNHRNYDASHRVPGPYGVVYPIGYDAHSYKYFPKQENIGYYDQTAFTQYLETQLLQKKPVLVLQPNPYILELCLNLAKYRNAKKILDGIIAPKPNEPVITPDKLRELANQLFSQNMKIREECNVLLKNTNDMLEYGDKYLQYIQRATCILKSNLWSSAYYEGGYIYNIMFKNKMPEHVYWNGVLNLKYYMYRHSYPWSHIYRNHNILVLCDNVDDTRSEIENPWIDEQYLYPTAKYTYYNPPPVSYTIEQTKTWLEPLITNIDVAWIKTKSNSHILCALIYELGKSALEIYT